MTDLADITELTERVQFLAGLGGTEFYAVQPGSTLAADDVALAPLGASGVVRASFESSTRLVAELLPLDAAGRGASPASFALLRAALAAASVTIWLLEPEDAAGRRARALSETWGDIRDADRLQVALGSRSDTIRMWEHDWRAARDSIATGADPALPVAPDRKLEVAATVVADFTGIPNAAGVIRASFVAFDALARGRSQLFDLAEGDNQLFAGSLSLVLDVLETAASLYHVRVTAPASSPG